MTRPHLGYPVEDHTSSQQFGEDNTNHPERRTFYTLFENKHPGIDFPVPIGTLVFASFPGIVVRKEFHKGMGNVIGVQNGNIVALYAHLSQMQVELGDVVEEHTLLGLSGDTGAACLVPHLHLELRDLTQPYLKEMVFEPIFDEEIQQWRDTFTYTVNNDTTIKTLSSLSLRYFGKEEYWQKIQTENPTFPRNRDTPLSQNTLVKLPNYV